MNLMLQRSVWNESYSPLIYFYNLYFLFYSYIYILLFIIIGEKKSRSKYRGGVKMVVEKNLRLKVEVSSVFEISGQKGRGAPN